MANRQDASPFRGMIPRPGTIGLERSTMHRNTLIICGAIAACLTAGLLIGQSPPPLPASPPGSLLGDDGGGFEWQLVPGDIAGYGGAGSGGDWAPNPGGWAKGDMFLINRRTGKVYLFYGGCTVNGVEQACFGNVAVINDPHSSDTLLPTPQAGSAVTPER